jgi:hypothetical protein
VRRPVCHAGAAEISQAAAIELEKILGQSCFDCINQLESAWRGSIHGRVNSPRRSGGGSA